MTRNQVLSDHCIFTVKVPEQYRCGRATYTYHVKKSHATMRYPVAYFVRLELTPDHWIYLGRLDEFTGQVETTPASKLGDNAYPLRLLNHILARIWGDDALAFVRCGFRVQAVEPQFIATQ